MKRSLIFSFMVIGSICHALDPVAVTNAALFVKTRGLESAHSSSELMAHAAETNGWTPQDCSEVLRLAYDLFRWSTNAFDVGCCQHAVSLLGEFGGTNAIPDLLSIMHNDEGIFKFYAGQGYIHVVQAQPALMSPLKMEMARSTQEGWSFAREIYSQVDFDLTYDAPSPVYHRNLLRFLLDQAVVERSEYAMLDEILCREVPKWRASPQRAENAERMIRAYPANTNIVAFFAAVRTNALESVLAARGNAPANPANATDRASLPTGPIKVKDAAAAQEPDRWADLLDELPEKTPWEPPPGAPLPF